MPQILTRRISPVMIVLWKRVPDGAPMKSSTLLAKLIWGSPHPGADHGLVTTIRIQSRCSGR